MTCLPEASDVSIAVLCIAWESIQLKQEMTETCGDSRPEVAETVNHERSQRIKPVLHQADSTKLRCWETSRCRWYLAHYMAAVVQRLYINTSVQHPRSQLGYWWASWFARRAPYRRRQVIGSFCVSTSPTPPLSVTHTLANKSVPYLLSTQQYQADFCFSLLTEAKKYLSIKLWLKYNITEMKQ